MPLLNIITSVHSFEINAYFTAELGTIYCEYQTIPRTGTRICCRRVFCWNCRTDTLTTLDKKQAQRWKKQKLELQIASN